MTEVALRPRPVVPTAVVAGVLAAAAAGWLVLVGRMTGMYTGPGGDPGTLGWFAATWAVMTVAMMLPASAPAVLRLARARGSTGAVLFVVGYGLVWMVAGLAGYWVVQSVRDLHAGAMAWSSAGRYVAGAAVAAAGLYQLTGAKRRWLARCAAPDRPRVRPGIAGALLAGTEHGCCCVACCWTLMVALYALGMMSIAWMAMLTVLIAGERLVPWRTIGVRGVAVVLVVLGVAVAATPAAVPALTVPAKGGAAMIGMSMGR
jgi:predicted metal-binding membrane protein